VIIGLGDFFGLFIILSIIIFLVRRTILTVPRFKGQEMDKKSKWDANIALTFILLLMISLLGMNGAYVALHPGDFEGVFPISQPLAG